MPSPEAIAHFDERFECHAPRAVTPAARALPLTSLTSAAQTAPGHMLGGLPLGQLTNSGGGFGGVSNALRMPPRAYVMPRVPAAG